jgi:predicted GTPase
MNAQLGMSRKELEDHIRAEVRPMLPMLATMAAANLSAERAKRKSAEWVARECFDTYRSLHTLALNEVMKPVEQPNIPPTNEVFRPSMEQGPPRDGS